MNMNKYERLNQQKKYRSEKSFSGKKRVAAYCRVSTEKEEQAQSFESQCDFFRCYIEEKKEWEFYKVFADEGISGTSTKKREQFNQMIAEAKQRKFDLLITKEISRFARNTLDSIYYTREKIINSDAGSAETIQESLKEECTLNYGWSDHIRDKNYVYYRGKIVEGADPETFKCISYNVYSDKNNIYLKNTILKNVKENEIIFFDKWDKGYYIRGNDIYYEAIKLDGININDFQYINPERSFSYIKSTKNVYLYGKKIIGADPKTFKISFEGYLISQDKNHRCFLLQIFFEFLL